MSWVHYDTLAGPTGFNYDVTGTCHVGMSDHTSDGLSNCPHYEPEAC